MKRLLGWGRANAVEFPVARRRCDLVIVMAVADGEWLGVADLLDSLDTYLDSDYEVVAGDDASSDGTYERLLDAGCWVVRNPQRLHLAGNELTLRRAFIEAHRLFDAPIVLKLDPDSLVIGPGLPAVLRATFDSDATVGLAGTYRIDWNGAARDMSYWERVMLRRRQDFEAVFSRAIVNGYRPGDGVQGGGYALSRACLDELMRQGWLHGRAGYKPSHAPAWSVAEDSLIAMLVHAAGFKVAEIGGPGQALALWHVGLPMTIDDLERQNRLLTHSIKYKDENLAIRAHFRKRRKEARAKDRKSAR